MRSIHQEISETRLSNVELLQRYIMHTHDLVKMMQGKIVSIQAHWRSFRCRKRVQRFSTLPCEVWHIILMYVEANSKRLICMERILRVRIVRMYWSPPNKHLFLKLSTLQLVRRLTFHIDRDVVYKAFLLAHRILEYSYIGSTKFRLLVNAAIEDFYSFLNHSVST